MDIFEQYNNVFKDCVECYLEGMYDDDRPSLTEEDIEHIAYRLIYKQDYLWEVINETIYCEIQSVIKEKEGEKNE